MSSELRIHLYILLSDIMHLLALPLYAVTIKRLRQKLFLDFVSSHSLKINGEVFSV